REQIGRPRRHDREAGVGARKSVHGTLNHPVAAPDEDQLRALVERPLDLGRRLAALVDLEPQGVLDTALGERLAKLAEAAVEALARVCDHRDGAHLDRSARTSAVARAVRAANSATSMAATPIRAPAATSIG